jgi:DNA transposition AAA+ family ATPase
MTTLQKNEVVALIQTASETLGSNNAVANRCGVSSATISQITNQRWENIADGMWRKIAAALGWKPSEWQIVNTTNTRLLHGLYEDARANAMWVAVAERAGSGKTMSARSYAADSGRRGVYYVQAREWHRRSFLEAICTCLGLKVSAKQTTESLIVQIVSFFHERTEDGPLLIIDEADKLFPGALRALIPIYNELEDELAVVIQGTDNLERQFQNGVEYDKKGYDELASRFGRSFVSLYGSSRSDIRAICSSNGLTDRERIAAIWDELPKEKVTVNGRGVRMVTDLRRLRRLVRRELLATSKMVPAHAT